MQISQHIRSFSLILGSALLAFGCTKEAPPSTLAPAGVAQSFSATPNPKRAAGDLEADASFLTLNPASLDKEFLLFGSIIPQEINATSTSLNSRIVTFHRSGKSVFMLQSTDGRVVDVNMPATLILAELPILSESDSQLVLDFNRGMREIFTAQSYSTAEDREGYSLGDPTYKINISYVNSIQTMGNEIEISQVAQVDAGQSGPGAMVENYEVRYYLEPYRSTPGFVPHAGTIDPRYVAYFETSARLEAKTGVEVTAITKWDTQKPITYSISANTPAEFVQPITEGVLYWNKVFGKEVVRVDMAPADVHAPDPRYNVIQWVDNDSAAMLYSDSQSDPRTGEIQHAQIFMHSGLYANARQGLIGYLRNLNVITAAAVQAKTKTKKSKLSLRGFELGALCDYAPEAEFTQDVAALVSQGVDSSMIGPVIQNYARFTAAHEVGHTLGLRHNFAGSLAATLDSNDRNKVLMTYLKTGAVPPASTVFTSSVMDYTVLSDSVLAGAQLLSNAEPLAYDKVAIDYGYSNKDIPQNSPLFCTDSEIGKYGDCNRFDTGANPLIANTESIFNLTRVIPMEIVEDYIGAKTSPKLKTPVDQVNINETAYGTELLGVLVKNAEWILDPSMPLAVDRSVVHPTGASQAAAIKAAEDWRVDQVKKAGGVDLSLFIQLPASDRSAFPVGPLMLQGVDAYLAREDVKKGIGYDGQPYELTPDEIKTIKAGATLAIGNIVSGVNLSFLKGLRTVPVKGALADSSEERILPIANEFLLARKDGNHPTATLLGDVNNPKTTADQKKALLGGKDGALPQFSYPAPVRLMAIQLLEPAGRPQHWAEVYRLQLSVLLNDQMVAVLGKDSGDIDPLKLNSLEREWYDDQMLLIKALSNLDSNGNVEFPSAATTEPSQPVNFGSIFAYQPIYQTVYQR